MIKGVSAMIVHVTVRTSKLKETLEFYQWLLGLPISWKLYTPTGEIIFLGENETKFELFV
jgi:catechol 2,3-dioxygenase-like lactoylglutathione lyase family enzyme